MIPMSPKFHSLLFYGQHIFFIWRPFWVDQITPKLPWTLQGQGYPIQSTTKTESYNSICFSFMTSRFVSFWVIGRFETNPLKDVNMTLTAERSKASLIYVTTPNPQISLYRFTLQLPFPRHLHFIFICFPCPTMFNFNVWPHTTVFFYYNIGLCTNVWACCG